MRCTVRQPTRTAARPIVIGSIGVMVGLFGPPTIVTAAPAKGPCPGLVAVTSSGSIHAPFDRLLRAYVHDGFVEYGCFKQHEGILDAYRSTLAETDPSGLSRDERMALWINAYNAFTIKMILERYPGIRSIKQISDRWSRARWIVGGKVYSLGQIEHEILGKQFADPRFHFAIVCASLSCPILASEAYEAEKLDEQLTTAARRFLADSGKGSRTATEKGLVFGYNHRLYLSKVFKWAADDFIGAHGSVVDAITPYLDKQDRAFVKQHRRELSIRYLPYDWSLNGR